jgi:AcrR family transcriptional regulator
MTKRQGQEELLRQAVPIFVNLPYEHLSLQGVADACGTSLWALRYHFANVERLFRAVAHRLIDDVEARTDYSPEPGLPVLQSITAYADFLAGLMQSDCYRNLLYFVLRNGRHHPWLETAYQQRLVAKACTGLERIVLQAGESLGANVVLQAGAARRFYKRLETELALSSLLPASADAPPTDRAELAKAAAREAFAATYVFDWQASTAA